MTRNTITEPQHSRLIQFASAVALPLLFTDLALTVPKTAAGRWGAVDYGQFRHRRRLNDETGYTPGGESTGVYLADQPLEAFLEVVEMYLLTADVPPRRRSELREYAIDLKRDGSDRDVDILTRVIAAAESDAE